MLRDFLERHRVGISSFVAVVMPLFLLYVHGRTADVRKTTIIEVALIAVTSPVQDAASSMLSGLDDVWSGYIALTDVEHDNERLRKEAALLNSTDGPVLDVIIDEIRQGGASISGGHLGGRNTLPPDVVAQLYPGSDIPSM
ncbi:MAG: hypothetical protein QF464_23275, partial [Myxococcota bacterium]|nr:hypothetical protein [Myxococcota bacterium]